MTDPDQLEKQLKKALDILLEITGDPKSPDYVANPHAWGTIAGAITGSLEYNCFNMDSTYCLVDNRLAFEQAYNEAKLRSKYNVAM